MAAEAESRKDLLIKHGLSEEVLSSLKVALDEFQSVVEQGSAGRLAHVGAHAELDAIADEVFQIVKVMNGLNRIRFAQQPDLWAKWVSASNVVAAPQPYILAVAAVDGTADLVIKPMTAISVDGITGTARSAEGELVLVVGLSFLMDGCRATVKLAA